MTTNRKETRKEKLHTFMHTPMPDWASGAIVSLIGAAIFVGGAVYGVHFERETSSAPDVPVAHQSQKQHDDGVEMTFSNHGNDVRVAELPGGNARVSCSGENVTIHPMAAEQIREKIRDLGVKTNSFGDPMLYAAEGKEKVDAAAIAKIDTLLTPMQRRALVVPPGHDLCQKAYTAKMPSGGAQ